jgi:hypothetical protein
MPCRCYYFPFSSPTAPSVCPCVSVVSTRCTSLFERVAHCLKVEVRPFAKQTYPAFRHQRSLCLEIDRARARIPLCAVALFVSTLSMDDMHCPHVPRPRAVSLENRKGLRYSLKQISSRNVRVNVSRCAHAVSRHARCCSEPLDPHAAEKYTIQ